MRGSMTSRSIFIIHERNSVASMQRGILFTSHCNNGIDFPPMSVRFVRFYFISFPFFLFWIRGFYGRFSDEWCGNCPQGPGGRRWKRQPRLQCRTLCQLKTPLCPSRPRSSPLPANVSLIHSIPLLLHFLPLFLSLSSSFVSPSPSFLSFISDGIFSLRICVWVGFFVVVVVVVNGGWEMANDDLM